MKVIFIGTVASAILGFRGPLIKELLSRGHEVFAFAVDYSNEQKKTLIEWGVVPVDYNLSRSGLNPISDLKMMFRLRRELLIINPDIVFSYFVKPVIYGTLAARLAKVPQRIAMLEGLGFAFTEQPEDKPLKTKLIQRVQLLLYRLAFPATTHLIFLNHDDSDELLNRYRLPVRSTSVLGGIGLDLEEYPYKELNNSQTSFLYIGRLLKEKGVFEFLAAAKLVKRQHPEAEFVILGGVDYTSPNSLSIKELNKCIESGLITYPGQVDNVLEWIGRSSVFVLPSFREGSPRSSQEAMAVGRPIITTDVPGCRETVMDGKNGFLIPAFDVKKLAEKMIWFIENPDQIKAMGLVSRKIAEDKYDVRKVNKEILKIMGIK